MPGEPFLLYAETFFADVTTLQSNLDALQRCVDGTSRTTPSVATYLFRPSRAATLAGQSPFPGCVAIESTELYLTDRGFHEHLQSDEFRAGLRKMYREIPRLGLRIFWIGERPTADALAKIHRSDPDARPVAALRIKLFDAEVHRSVDAADLVLASVSVMIEDAAGAAAVEHVDRLYGGLRTVTFVAFFHPYDPRRLRVLLVTPVHAAQPVAHVAEALRSFASIAAPSRSLIGDIRLHASRSTIVSGLDASLSGTGDWTVDAHGYRGYVGRPDVSVPS